MSSSRLFPLLLVAALALCVVTCGEGKKDKKAEDVPPAAEPPVEEPGTDDGGRDGKAEETPTVCKFPKFKNHPDGFPLKTKDAGKCDKALAAEFGGDCANFHWLGLAFDPFIFFDSGKFRLWYTGGERVGEAEWLAGPVLAESADGVHWDDPKDLVKDTVLVLRPGTAGIDEQGIETVSVAKLVTGDALVMLYTGDRSPKPNSIHVIGRADSTDGKSWVKTPEPVLVASLPWEMPIPTGDGGSAGGVLEPSLLIEKDRWRLWYTAFGAVSGETRYARIGLAESADGRTWTKRPEPVFVGGGKPFEVNGVAHTQVTPDPVKGYHLFYAGIAADETLRIGQAYSEDGIVWEADPDNPVVDHTAGSWNDAIVGGPTATFVQNQLFLYYMGSKKADFSGESHFGLMTGSCAP